MIVTGPSSLKFHGHIAPVSTGARLYQNSLNTMNPRGKVAMRLKTAGGTDENSISATRLEKTTGRAISTAVDLNLIHSLNAVYQNGQSQKKEKTQSLNNFEVKVKNLKKMYNNQVKIDYNSDMGNKTSIRNKKNRISHDIGSSGIEGKRGSEVSSQMKQIKK